MKNPTKEEIATAYHEAGHAVVHRQLDLRFKHVQVGTTDEALGLVLGCGFPKWVRPDIEITPRTKDRLERHIIACLAGHEAERIHTGRNNWRGSESDYEIVLDFIDRLCDLDDELRNAFYKYMRAYTRSLLSRPQHWNAVEALAKALLDCKPNRKGIRRIRYTDAVEIIRVAELAHFNKLMDEKKQDEKSK